MTNATRKPIQTWKERIAVVQAKNDAEMKTLKWRLRHPIKTIGRAKRRLFDKLDDMLD